MVHVKPFSLKKKEGENNKSFKYVAVSFTDQVEENHQNDEKKIKRRFNVKKRHLVLQNYTKEGKDKSKRDIYLTSNNWNKLKLHFGTIDKWFSQEDEKNLLSKICLEGNRIQDDNDDVTEIDDDEEEDKEKQEKENFWDFVDEKRKTKKRKILFSSSCDYEYQRMLTFSIFKDKKYIHIRTYYNLKLEKNNGKEDKRLIPTKTGVCLSSRDWEKFKTYFDIIDKIFLDDKILISEFGIFKIFQLPRYNSFVDKFILF